MIFLTLCAVFCSIQLSECVCPQPLPSTPPTGSVSPTTPATVTQPPPPLPTTTQIGQWVFFGSLKITNPAEIRAFLTAPYSRTPEQAAIVKNITDFITSKVCQPRLKAETNLY